MQNSKQKNREELISIYDKYIAGETPIKVWCECLVVTLEDYIKYRIGVKKRYIGAEWDDLMQQGYLAICDNVKNYNPHIAAPGTFFTPYIDQYTKDICKNPGMTAHYNSIYNKMDNAAKKYGFDGCEDPKLTAEKLSIIADCPMASVVEALKHKQWTEVSFEAASENFELEDTTFKNPETVIIERETMEFVRERLARCTPLEQYLIEIHNRINEPVSFRKMCSLFDTPEYRRQFSELPKNLNQVYFERKYSHAIEKIRYMPSYRKAFSEYGGDTYEQATEEDFSRFAFESVGAL